MSTSILSHIHGPVDLPLLQETIGTALRRAASEDGDRLAMISVFQDRALSFAELDSEVDKIALGLLRQEIGPGDRVAIWSANRIEWLIAHHAIVRIGAVAVKVNPALRTEEAFHILADSAPRAIFASRAFRQFSFHDALADLTGRLPFPLLRISFDRDPPEGWSRWEDVAEGRTAAALASLRAIEARILPDDPCSLQYTSGTTGKPKGALLTHRGILNNGYFVGMRQHLTDADRICLPVPFFHCFGIVLGALAALTHRSALILPGESFDPVQTLRTVADYGCTSLYGVPTMFIAMLNHPMFKEFDLSTLRTGCMGGAPCPVTTMSGAVSRMNMHQVTITYGMTETSPISFQSLATDSEAVRVSTVGVAYPHVEAKIVDPVSGETVPRNQTGELRVRGYSVMKGYWGRPDATSEAIDSQGWMHTGDLAVLNESGYLRIVGRLKDTIIRGGENIYPREVEEYLLTLDGVAEAYVFGIPDPTYGELVCCWLRRRDAYSLDDESLRALCKGKIASYKIPHKFRIVTEFPMTTSGKVQKYVMREREVQLSAKEESAHSNC